MNYSYTITKNTLTIHVDGESVSLPRDSYRAKYIEDLIKKHGPENLTKEQIKAAVDKNTMIAVYANKDLTINADGSVVRNGLVLPAALAEQVFECYKAEVPYDYLLKFFDKLQKNPSKRSVDYLCSFLAHRQMPITKDGNFLAYKAIQSDWTDKHTGAISNKVGTVPTVPRNTVCDDPNMGCSVGLHAGSLAYATSFANSTDRIVIVSINPADVVCVPHDCEYQKLRTCTYKVVAEYREPLVNSAVRDEDNPYGTAFGDDLSVEDLLTILGQRAPDIVIQISTGRAKCAGKDTAKPVAKPAKKKSSAKAKSKAKSKAKDKQDASGICMGFSTNC